MVQWPRGIEHDAIHGILREKVLVCCIVQLLPCKVPDRECDVRVRRLPAVNVDTVGGGLALSLCLATARGSVVAIEVGGLEGVAGPVALADDAFDQRRLAGCFLADEHESHSLGFTASLCQRVQEAQLLARVASVVRWNCLRIDTHHFCDASCQVNTTIPARHTEQGLYLSIAVTAYHAA